MGNYMSILRECILLVTLASIFAIFWVTVLKVIRRAAFYRGKMAVLISGALSILFLVALSEFLVGPGGADHTIGPDTSVKTASHSLLPGVALGVSAGVLLSQVLLLASRTSPDERPESLVRKSERSVVKPKLPGRPKKQPESPPTPQKPGGKRKNEAKVSPVEVGATT